MSTAVATTESNKSSLIESMAAKYGLEPAKFFQSIKATVFNGQGTQEEFIAFLTVANRYNLDPFCREIYAFPKKGGGIQAVVGVDGWAAIINDNPTLDGIEYEDRLDDKGELIAITCRIYRKDRSRPTACTEYMAECNRKNDVWNKWPRRMLRHKATIQCARMAFALSGIVDPDEAEREQSVQSNGNGHARVSESKLNDMLGKLPSSENQPRNEPIDVDASDPPGDDGPQVPATFDFVGFNSALLACKTFGDVDALSFQACVEGSYGPCSDKDEAFVRKSCEARKQDIQPRGEAAKQKTLA